MTDTTKFLNFTEAAEATGLPEWLLRKMTWDGRLPSYHPQGPRGRTFIKLADLYDLMESYRSDDTRGSS